jgi:hypothetical protein
MWAKLVSSASVRTIQVNDTDYLQVVRYFRKDGKNRIKVIKSFGQDTLENRLKAQQFASNYNSLAEIAQQELERNETKNNIVTIALVLFGLILGAAIIKDLIDEIFS